MVEKIFSNTTLYGEFKYSKESFKNFATHSHSGFNIVAIESSSIEIVYHNQGKQILQPMQLALFNPNHVHLTKNLSNSPIGYYSLMLDKCWCIKIQNKIFDNREFIELSPTIINDSTLNQKFTLLYNSLQNSDNLENRVKEFATTLFQNYCTPASAENSSKSRKNQLQEIENHIRKNIEESLNIDEIAKTTGYSTAHLNRLFKEEYGLTLHAFLIDQRIHKAKELLSKNRHLSLTEIAYSVGFYDQSHFIRNFKKAYSLSPKAYRLFNRDTFKP